MSGTSPQDGAMDCECDVCRGAKTMPDKPPNKKKREESQDIFIVHEDASLKEKLPPSFIEEWKKLPELKDKYVEFMKHMLTTGTLADVTFRLKGEVNDEEKIQAHKVLLKRKSEFFSALFSDRWEQQDVIDLTKTGVNSVEFKVFLEYLYTDRASITNDNVLPIYHLTNMYLGKSDLKDRCETFLMKNIDEENVLELFNAVFPHDVNRDSEMLTRLIRFICTAGEPMLDRNEMKLMDLAGLSRIFSQREFNCRPKKLLRFCLGWIKFHCGPKDLENFHEVDVRMLSDFRVTERNGGFCDFPKLATAKICSSNARTAQASNDPNTVYKFCRFKNIGPKHWIYRRNRADRISFRVSESVIITALGFYGDYNYGGMRQVGELTAEPTKYSLDISIYLHGKLYREFLNVFRRAGKDMKFPSNTFKVDVDPCLLQSDTWYTIAVKMRGEPSYCGTGGCKEKITICGKRPLIFEFQEACANDENEKLANPTGVPMGQIPEIYFKLATDGSDDDIVVL